MNSNGFYSRTELSRDDWETPLYFFNLLDNIFRFTLDPCASAKNAKCKKYYTIKENGLIQDWKGETVFVNPPYNQKKVWLKKCYTESQKEGTLVVVILPVRTDTIYFHEYCMKAHEIWFCKGRVNFLLDGKKPKNGATFPSTLVRPMILSGSPKFLCKKCRMPREKIGKYTNCGCNAGWDTGIVLDIFAGTGTTLFEAFKQGRDYIGFEISPTYIEMAKNKLKTAKYKRLDSF